MGLADDVKRVADAGVEVTQTAPLSDDEAALLESLRRGEDRGYETLVRTYGPRVLAVTRRYLRVDHDAQDCFQDTFMTVYQQIDTFQQRSSLGAWVRGIAVNQCLMKLRQQRRRHEQSIDDLLPTFDERGRRVAQGPGLGSEQAETLDAQGRQRMVRDSIDRLPDAYRTVLLLRDMDGYTTNETASILGIRENAVKTRLHRARSALKTLLDPLLAGMN